MNITHLLTAHGACSLISHLAREHLRSLVEQEPEREQLKDLAYKSKITERCWDARVTASRSLDTSSNNGRYSR